MTCRLQRQRSQPSWLTGPKWPLRMLKRSIHLAAQLSWDQSLDEIAAKTAITDHLPDAAEGVASFVQKRDPQYNAWLR